ncbi:hypothetical protein [Nocardiopsis coralliicola]
MTKVSRGGESGGPAPMGGEAGRVQAFWRALDIPGLADARTRRVSGGADA